MSKSQKARERQRKLALKAMKRKPQSPVHVAMDKLNRPVETGNPALLTLAECESMLAMLRRRKANGVTESTARDGSKMNIDECIAEIEKHRVDQLANKDSNDVWSKLKLAIMRGEESQMTVGDHNEILQFLRRGQAVGLGDKSYDGMSLNETIELVERSRAKLLGKPIPERSFEDGSWPLPHEIIASLDAAMASGDICHGAENEECVRVCHEKYALRLLVMAGAEITNSKGRKTLPFTDYFFGKEIIVQRDEGKSHLMDYRRKFRIVPDICYRSFYVTHLGQLLCTIAVRDAAKRGHERFGLACLAYINGHWNFIGTALMPYDLRAYGAEMFGGFTADEEQATAYIEMFMYGLCLLRSKGPEVYRIRKPRVVDSVVSVPNNVTPEPKPEAPYDILYVNKPRVVYENPDSNHPPSDPTHGTPKRPHDREGTWVHYKSGKVVWRKSAKIHGGAEHSKPKVVRLAMPIEPESVMSPENDNGFRASEFSLDGNSTDHFPPRPDS